MEGQQISDFQGGNKFNAKKAEIAAAGNRPEDWKTYIDETKFNVKDLQLEEKKKRVIISYMYHKAFQTIPVSNTSLAHALLLVDYAIFKSDQSIEDAEKLMFHGRRYLRMHAIIHVASAELELKKGNRDKAALILKRAIHYGAKPDHLITEAKGRLTRNCTKLLRTDSKENESSLDYSSGHNSSSGSGVELTGESSQLCLRQMDPGHERDGYANHWPSCRSSTEELQQGLDLIPHSHSQKLTSFTSSAASQSEKSKGHAETLDDLDSLMPEPPSLLSHPFQDLANKDITGPRRRQDSGNITADGSAVAGNSNDLAAAQDFFHTQPQGAAGRVGDESSLYKTPQVSAPRNPLLLSHAKKGEGAWESASKLNHSRSASSILQSAKRPTLFSANKVKLLNLPPQRVRVDQYVSDDSEEEDKEHSESRLAKGSASMHTDNAGSSSLTSRTGQCQRSLFSSLSKGNSQDGSASSANVFPPSLHKNLSLGSLPMETNAAPDKSQNGTFGDLRRHDGPSTFTKAKRPNLESADRQFSSELSQPHPALMKAPQRDVHSQELHRNAQLDEHSKHGMDGKTNDDQQGISSRASSREFPRQSSLPSHEANLQKHTHPVPESNPPSASCPPSGNQAPIPKAPEPAKVYGAAGATYSVPGQYPSQAVPANLVTPAKQIGQDPSGQVGGGQKIMYVNGKPYVVIKMIGRGGSAKVYQVQDPETLSMRALKCVNLSCVSKEVLEGYKNEIALLEKLQHCDRVIKLYSSEYVESKKKLLVVMECGETNLADFIAQHARNKDELHSVTICYLWGHMVKAVQAMHHAGVIHSDLKPANFLLVSGTIKLIDFGIANSLNQDKTSVMKSHVMGTPNYMSPEALMASSGDPHESRPRYKVGTRSDVWSLGCILYQMVYGHTPFQHVRLKLEAIVNPAHEIQFPPLEDAALMDILKKCLTRDVKQRPKTDELMNHPYLTKQKLATHSSNPVKQVIMEEEEMSSASPRTLKQYQYYLKKAEEFQSMASSLFNKKLGKDGDSQ